jgi:hypothetical protein
MTPHDREEIIRLDGELANARAENERLRARLDSAYIEGWKKGVVESIDKIAAYQATLGARDGSFPGEHISVSQTTLDKAIELLTIRFASPPEAPPQPTTPEPQAVPIAVFTAALEKSREQTIETIVETLIGYRDDATRVIAEAIYAALAKEP